MRHLAISVSCPKVTYLSLVEHALILFQVITGIVLFMGKCVWVNSIQLNLFTIRKSNYRLTP
jgi:hypothetical protein